MESFIKKSEAYDETWKLKGRPLYAEQLAALLMKEKSSIYKYLKKDIDDLKLLGWEPGNYPLPPLVVHYYTKRILIMDWIDGVNIIEKLKEK